MPQSATATLGAMHEVAKRLIPQIVQWITTEVVAKGKIVHAGVTQARALVRHKAGKAVECGLPYLLSRLGGEIFGTMICGVVDEAKMPLQALAGYPAIFGAQATPTLMVYDRRGPATAIAEGAGERGGQGAWHSAQRSRDLVRCRGGWRDGQKRAGQTKESLGH